MGMPRRWSIVEMGLAVLSVAVFIHAYRGKPAYVWEMYIAVAIGAALVVVSGVGFKISTNRVISAVCGVVGLIVLGHSLTQIAMAFLFNGQLP
jgi:hypothetical protein